MANQINNQYKTPIMKKVGGILILAVGLIFLYFTIFYAIKDIPLWVFGKQAKAEVVEIGLEQHNEIEKGEDGVLEFTFYIRYQFETPKGKVITKTAKASANEWSGMWEGQKIDIVYFPLYPDLNRMNDSNWTLFLACTYLPLIVISILGIRVGWYFLSTP